VKYDEATKSIVYKVLAVGLLLEIILYSIFSVEWGDVSSIAGSKDWTVAVGEAIFNDYGVAVVMLGLLLLAAIMGGVFLAQEDDDE
jgi:NADH:ubiquinone oxidoreductase subunit 6 (subunit J)